MQTKSEMINRIAELAEENAELKAKIIKYAELNEIDTRDYAALHNENIKLNAIIDGYQPRLQALKDAKDKYYQQTLDDEIQINELYQTLQEIKTIAEKIMLTDLCGNCDGIGLDGGCIDKNCSFYQMDKILDIINKAEEE